MKKILLAIDQPLLVSGICGLLKTGPESMDIQFSTTEISMLEMLNCNEYQLVIIKLSTVAHSIVMQVSKLRPALPILVFADSFDSSYFHKMYKSGALGVFNLQDGLDELSFAIEQTLDKKIYMANGFKQFMLNNSTKGVVSTVAVEQLTKRESEIAKLMLNGKKMCEISSLLDLRASTVTTFKSKIYTKLGVTNLLELDQVIKKHQN